MPKSKKPDSSSSTRPCPNRCENGYVYYYESGTCPSCGNDSYKKQSCTNCYKTGKVSVRREKRCTTCKGNGYIKKGNDF